MKIVTIIGARPQIIKAAAISRAIRNRFAGMITEVIVHTGQHYDANMSQVFFDELGIPQPDINLGVGSGPHGKQTALMIEGIEKVLSEHLPDYLVVYGDTNSTLAGAIAASKIHVPIVHIEAGLRSFNKSMPEEINRIMCDHVSTLLFTPTITGYNNLLKEGFSAELHAKADIDHPVIYHCGDVMYDNTLYFAGIADQKSSILKDYDLQDNAYILATIHRDNNTDDPARLSSIFKALDSVSRKHNLQIVLPLHPRTAGLLQRNLDATLYQSISGNEKLKILQPVSFLDMTCLEKHSMMILTDSGGVQKEAYFFNKPCVIARTETEWVEIVEAGAGIVADADSEKITNAVEYFLSKPIIEYKPVFGDGKAAEFICETMLEH
ncbi:MAG TPA: UDP-N-acetylglucosamine 2-epimerase (non-hydrolyzing) [Lentimicrobium sp.]|nr:UDP-N-acetylglucosamine 2-epimerase (non-hydrolyzing) [Lentimicrobium sp.]